MAIEALEGISDQELFDQANADEAPAEEVVAEPVEAVAEQPETVEAEANPEPEAEVEKPAADDNPGRVPAFRLREEAEARRRLENDLAQERADKAALRQRLEALERPAQKAEPEKPSKPDPLLDPDGYEKYLETKFEEKLLNNHRETDLRLTRQSNMELFDKAYGESQRLKEARDPAFLELSQKMHSTNAPGKVLLDWYNQRTLQAEVGNDLAAFRQREQERLLSDPAFLAKAIEKARGAAQTPTQPGAKPPVSLPPSLTRATNASADASADDNDVSDEGLWRHANA